MIDALVDFLKNSPTAYHVCENAREELLKRGFQELFETEDWTLVSGGKYLLTRGGSSLIAFSVGDLDEFSYKIVGVHSDSPALKLKNSPIKQAGAYALLNVEKYGGGIWHTFFDRPLKIAGRVVKREGERLQEENVLSPFTVTIPSLAIHQNRDVNEGFSVNPQIDLLPLLGNYDEYATGDTLIENIAGDRVVAYDLFLVNADTPYSFGIKDEFLASPRVDNLTGVYASLQSLFGVQSHGGVSLVACLDNEETGSLSPQGADGDFLKTTLRRIAYALRFDDNEYYKALANSFLLSVDNAHATHPHHPEKSDPTNPVVLGGGVVIKAHAGKSYITDARSSAIVQTVFQKANVPYQFFFNRSDMKSGSTLGSLVQRHVGVSGADVGIAQLAMHSASECFAKADYLALVNGLTAFFNLSFALEKGEIVVK